VLHNRCELKKKNTKNKIKDDRQPAAYTTAQRIENPKPREHDIKWQTKTNYMEETNLKTTGEDLLRKVEWGNTL